MNLRLIDGLPFVAVTVAFDGRELQLDNVLIDTGSAGTILAADQLVKIGVEYAEDDEVHRIRGVGGVEFVFAKPIERLAVGALHAERFNIEVGAMDYGFEINGIIGVDFSTTVGAVIDMRNLQILPA